MADYHVNKPIHIKIIDHMQSMDNVLREIAVTYEVLDELLTQQQRALRGPTIDMLRKDVQANVRRCIQQSVEIADKTHDLVEMSQALAVRLEALEQ